MSDVLPGDVRAALVRRLYELYQQHFGRVAADDRHLRQMALDSVDEHRAIAQLDVLTTVIGQPLSGKRLLEVGSGVGLTVAAARKLKGAEAFGIEPGTAEYDGTLKLSHEVLTAAGLDPAAVRQGVGEAIPFPDDYFDLVYSSNVLEHVNDPPRVIEEIVRVLKPGGCAQIVVPNYGSWWEGHYGVIWLPHLPAAMAKIYIRLLGRDTSFIDTLQLVTRGKLERWVATHRGRIDVLDWGVDIWEQRVRGLGFSEYSALGRLKSILRVLHGMRVIPVLIGVGKLLHWETPLILTFRKKVVVADG